MNILHSWNVTPSQAVAIQEKLKELINLKPLRRDIKIIAGVDVSYINNQAQATVVCLYFNSLEIIETKRATLEVKFPYIPGLLAFREGEVFLKAFDNLKNTPDVIIFDGQGIAHPRRVGIATHLGIYLNIPTIGCAKNKLIGTYKEPSNEKGAYSFLKDKEEIIGVVLRTKEATKPVFVSVGNKIDLDSATRITLACCNKYHLPEPLRQAHIISKETKFLGVLT